MGGHSYRRDVKARDYVVFDPAGEPVCRGFTCPDDAVRKIEQLEHEARRVDRPCMTCRAIFKSEGSHNRMCDTCRGRASGEDVSGHSIALPRRTGGRA
jgi:hypothetical protein